MKILCFTPLPYGDGTGWWSRDLALTVRGFRELGHEACLVCYPTTHQKDPAGRPVLLITPEIAASPGWWQRQKPDAVLLGLWTMPKYGAIRAAALSTTPPAVQRRTRNSFLSPALVARKIYFPCTNVNAETALRIDRHLLKRILFCISATLARPWSKLLSFPLPPRKTFSALAEVRRGKRSGRLIIKQQRMPRFGKESMTIRSGFHQHQQQPWPIFWSRHTDAHLVSPSLALVDPLQGLMVESAYGRFFRQDTAWTAIFAPRAQHLRGPWTSIVSHWCPISRNRNYYHWLFDALPRLSLLKYFPSSLRILVPGVLPRFARDSLTLLGLEKRCQIVSHPHVLIDDYFYSGLVGMTGCYNPYAVRYLRSAFLPYGRLRSLPHCFFVGRRHPNRSIQNNAEVEEYFRNRGWSVLHLEDLSFQEQVSLFKNARAVCALHGAALANLVWCRPETYVMEIFAHNYLQGAYEGIAMINKLDYHPVIFKASRSRRPFVNLEILNFCLKDCPN